MMKSRRDVVLSVSVALSMCAFGASAFAKPGRSPVYGLDPDNDGTVDLEEAKRAASALFDRLDRDHDGTLDRRELRGRLSAKELNDADPDHDGTLYSELQLFREICLRLAELADPVGGDPGNPKCVEPRRRVVVDDLEGLQCQLAGAHRVGLAHQHHVGEPRQCLALDLPVADADPSPYTLCISRATAGMSSRRHEALAAM